MKMENASLSLLVCQTHSSLCNKFHKSQKSIDVMKDKDSCKKTKVWMPGMKENRILKAEYE